MEKTTVRELRNESERIQVLKKYEILDTPPDASLDNITKMAAELLGMPMALISLVDKDRVWFKSKYGVEDTEVKKSSSLCTLAILQDDLFLIEDAMHDARTMSHQEVIGGFGLRFYAGFPLKTREGFNLGTLCVFDKKSRGFTSRQKHILKNFSQLVVQQLELRLEAKIAVRNQHQILNITAHDLKNPLSIMPLLAEMIIENKHNPNAIDDIAKQIKGAGKRMNLIIEDLLENARKDMGRIQLRLKPLDFSQLIKGVVASNFALARKKKQLIKLNLPKTFSVFGDHSRLTEIVDNLLNNAIKYSPHGKNIYISLKAEEGMAVLEVKDEGPGLSKDDIKHLFRKFTSLSAQPTGGEKSSGLGLSIVKQLVDAHRGEVYGYSEGKGKGASFVVKIPVSEDI